MTATAGHPPGALGPESLDYLQRVADTAPPAPDAPARTVPPDRRRLLQVTAVGRPDKGTPTRVPVRPDAPPGTVPLVVGLAGKGLPLAFTLGDRGDGLEVGVGTWLDEPPSGTPGPNSHPQPELTLAALLSGTPTEVDLHPVPDPEPVAFPRGGLVVGLPTIAPAEGHDQANPADRLVRTMAGHRWGAVVLARPVPPATLAALRAQLINEMRAATAARHDPDVPSPLADHYGRLLEAVVVELTEALSVGGWRVATYLVGDAGGYPALAAAWRGVLSSGSAVPESVRVVDAPGAVALAARWASLDGPGHPGPGFYQRPFEWQTVMSSTRLATIAQLPSVEVPGFSVRLAPRFDVEAPAVDPAAAVPVGTVLHRSRPAATAYAVPARSLTRHAFVAGVTGSGKTNTIFSLLGSVHSRGVPFLVIEPTKREYRGLLDHPAVGPTLRIHTVGDETAAPLRLNPFDLPPGAAVAEHLDLLRSVFDASFGMWPPLPEVLEQALHAIYQDKGWDLRTGTNHRLGVGAGAGGTAGIEVPAEAFPDLGDLVAKVDELVPLLGYEDRITADIRAALVTRLESLRVGAKGAMFDVAASTPIDELLGRPTVLELEALADDDDKAFFIGLLLIKLVEHRRAAGVHRDLRHVLVLEEAHRLLANVPQATATEMGNPKGKAVEVFTSLLSEIRAYGQSVITADQVPTRLAPDVVKNTNLKVIHRLVARDDREAVGAAMAMDDAQLAALATLRVGQAAVYSEGDDAPLLVAVPKVKDLDERRPLPDDAAVAARADPGSGAMRPRAFCAATCATPAACDTGRDLAADGFVQRLVARLVVSATEHLGSVGRQWPDLVAAVRSRRPAHVDDRDALRALAGHGADWLAQRRGAQAAWSYADTAAYAGAVRDLLLAAAEGSSTAPAQAALAQVGLRLHARTAPPFPACDRVCDQQPPVCLYRWSVADVVVGGAHQAGWRAADEADAAAPPSRARSWSVCQDVAYELVDWPDPSGAGDDDGEQASLRAAARRASLCVQQQLLAADERKAPRSVHHVMQATLAEAGMD